MRILNLLCFLIGLSLGWYCKGAMLRAYLIDRVRLEREKRILGDLVNYWHKRALHRVTGRELIEDSDDYDHMKDLH